ncbi:hypothetical protein CTH30272_00978 [Allocatenococcus thiocycli]|nr:hypothetical protein CTH30272_00978 [Catenococcus thiocycli]
MSSFPDLLTAFQEAVDALKVKLSQDPNASTSYNNEAIQSIAKDVEDAWSGISAMVQGRSAFETKTDLLSSGAPPADQLLADVWKDPEFDNNGLYGWDGAAWVKSDYDPTKLAKVLDKEANNYPFSSISEDDGNTTIAALRDFIVDVNLVSSADEDYWVWRIKRNNGGEWEINIHDLGGRYGQFITTENPENGNAVTTHVLTGNIPGKVTVDWSKIPDGTLVNNGSNNDRYQITPQINEARKERLFDVGRHDNVDERLGTISEFVSNITLDRDRIFTVHDVVGTVHVNLIGPAAPGKVLSLELSHNVTGLTFNKDVRVESGALEADPAPGMCNYVYVMNVGDQMIDVIYRYAPASRALVLPPVPVKVTTDLNGNVVTVVYSGSLSTDPLHRPMPNDFSVGTKNKVTSVSISGNQMILTLESTVSETAPDPTSYKSTNKGSRPVLHFTPHRINEAWMPMGLNGCHLDPFTQRIYKLDFDESFNSDPLDPETQTYPWVVFGNNTVMEVLDGILTMQGTDRNGLRINDRGRYFESGSIIEVRYRNLTGSSPLATYNGNNEWEALGASSVTQGEWVIGIAIWRPQGVIGPKVHHFHVVSHGELIDTYEIDYVRVYRP